MTTKMNKIIKIVSLLMIVVTVVSLTSTVFADTKYGPDQWDIASGDNIETEGLVGWVASIMKVVAIVGSGVAVIALIILGIKYMMGSVEEKAEYKKTLIPYVVGALMVFGASAIVGFLANVIE